MARAANPKLSDRYAQKLSCPKGKKLVLIPDVTGNGLCLQITATGDKKWKFRFDHAGKRNHLKDIGPANLISYEEAKAKAAAYQRCVKIDKRHPDTLDYDPKQAPIFNDVLDLQAATVAPQTARNLRTKLQPLRDAFGAEPVTDVTRQRLRAFIDKQWSGSPGTARLIVRNLSAAFTKAMNPDSGLSLPADFANPAQKLGVGLVSLRDHQPKSRAVAYETAELQAIFRVLEESREDDKLGNVGLACLELILLTGARPSEIKTLTWDEIEEVPEEADLRHIVKQRHKTWKKTGRPRRIVVNALGIEVLERAAAWKAPGVPYVFPARRIQRNTKDHFFSSDHALCEKLSVKAGLKIRAGSFRSAYINFMLGSLEQQGHGLHSLYDALEVVAENVGHTDVRITLDHYRKGTQSKMHEAVRVTNTAFAALRAA